MKDSLTHIEENHHLDDVVELSHYLRMLVKDMARNLHISNLRRIVERAGGRDVVESPSK